MTSEGILDPKLLQTYQGHKSAVNGVAYGLDGKLVTCSSDHTVQLWVFRNNLRSLKLMGHRAAVNAADISPKVKPPYLLRPVFTLCSCCSCMVVVWWCSNYEGGSSTSCKTIIIGLRVLHECVLIVIPKKILF